MQWKLVVGGESSVGVQGRQIVTICGKRETDKSMKTSLQLNASSLSQGPALKLSRL
jgi:hypothetical protein